MRLLKEVVRMMDMEQKKEFAIFWMVMYKEMFTNP